MKFVEDHPKATIAAALSIIILVVVLAMRPDKPPPAFQKVMDRHYESLTWQAREVAAHLPDGTKVVVLVFKAEVIPSTKSLFKNIYHAIEAEGVSIVHVEPLVHNEDAGWQRLRSGFPYSEYLRVAREHPDAGAIISLCSEPYGLTEEDRAVVSSLPILMVTRMNEWSPALQDMINDGHVAAAIVPRETATSDTFEGRYELLAGPGLKKQ